MTHTLTPDERHAVAGDGGSNRSGDLHDHIRQLTQPTTIRQYRSIKTGPIARRERKRRRIKPVACLIETPSLLDQLAAAIRPSSSIDSGRPGYQSGTAARIDAIDALNDITKDAGAWLKRLDTPDPHSDKLRIIRLGSLAPQLDRRTYDDLEDDIRHWWQWARILTGWDAPARRPNGTCPACPEPERGTLRVRVDERLATCVKCRATWDSATIGLLGEHIRTQNHEIVG